MSKITIGVETLADLNGIGANMAALARREGYAVELQVTIPPAPVVGETISEKPVTTSPPEAGAKHVKHHKK